MNSARISLGQVLSATLALARQEWGVILAAVLLVIIFDAVVGLFIYSSSVFQELVATDLQKLVLWNFAKSSTTTSLAAFFLGWVLALRANPASLAPVNPVYVFASLLGTALISGLGAALGLLFLVVPGLLLIVTWCVSVPIVVTEHRNPLQALKRSAELTKGNRWPIFFGLLLFGVIAIIVHSAGAEIYRFTLAISNDPVFTAICAIPIKIISLCNAMLPAIFSVALYFNLVEAKSGKRFSGISSVFD